VTKELLFSLSSPSRDDLNVYGFRFGSGAKRLAILSGLNGEELSGMFVASQLVAFLEAQEAKNSHLFDGEILIIPAINHFAFNMGVRFWPLDNTDINVMFPGFDQGETTQRIAHALFEHLQGYEYGIVIEDRKDRAKCLPYIKLIDSPYIDIEKAKDFGLPLIHLKNFAPTDSGSLLYNWGVWNTKAFSLVVGNKGTIDMPETQEAKESIIAFMSKTALIDYAVEPKTVAPRLIEHHETVVIKAQAAGVFSPKVDTGATVAKGDMIGITYDALCGHIKERFFAPMDGIITCMYNYPLIFQHSVAYRMVEVE